MLDQYFTNRFDGAAAADVATQKVIDMINALPETVSVADKEAVQAARAAYDLISTIEQKALVTNYSRLTAAEKRISDLEFLESEQQTTVPTEPDADDTTNSDPTVLIVIGVIAVVAVVILVLKKTKKNKITAEVLPSEEEIAEELDVTEDPDDADDGDEE